MSKKEATKSKKCMVCGKEVPKSEWVSINASVIGDYMPLWGHSTCVDNVDELVVVPNRFNAFKMSQLIARFDGGPKILERLKAYYE